MTDAPEPDWVSRLADEVVLIGPGHEVPLGGRLY